MEFDWDDANRNHLLRHRITPQETEEVLRTWPLEIGVEHHELDGIRVRSVGETLAGRILVVVTTPREHKTRVVTSWDAPHALKLRYLRAKVRDDENID